MIPLKLRWLEFAFSILHHLSLHTYASARQFLISTLIFRNPSLRSHGHPSQHEAYLREKSGTGCSDSSTSLAAEPVLKSKPLLQACAMQYKDALATHEAPQASTVQVREVINLHFLEEGGYFDLPLQVYFTPPAGAVNLLIVLQAVWWQSCRLLQVSWV